MRAKGIWVPLACALVASAVVTETASAFVRSSPPTASIRLKGSHGYSIRLQVEREFASVSVTESGKKAPSSPTSEYVVFGGQASADEVKASFGRFGKVAVRFIPSGRERRVPVPESCKGKPRFTRFGVFKGTIRFRGEDGYTKVDLSRATGTLQATPRQVCHRPKDAHRSAAPSLPREQGRELLVTTLTVLQASTGIGLTATRSEIDPTASLLFASSSESVGRVWVSRLAFLEASKDVFSFDPTLNTATLAPPHPFSGSATFQRVDDYTTRWEGPLAVSFPGRPDVPLTGRGFTATLDSVKKAPGASSTVFSTG